MLNFRKCFLHPRHSPSKITPGTYDHFRGAEGATKNFDSFFGLRGHGPFLHPVQGKFFYSPIRGGPGTSLESVPKFFYETEKKSIKNQIYLLYYIEVQISIQLNINTHDRVIPESLKFSQDNASLLLTPESVKQILRSRKQLAFSGIEVGSDTKFYRIRKPAFFGTAVELGDSNFGF